MSLHESYLHLVCIVTTFQHIDLGLHHGILHLLLVYCLIEVSLAGVAQRVGKQILDFVNLAVHDLDVLVHIVLQHVVLLVR